jgi:guanosine-3',5'-bis(diphosphate) 3'-pyrophosphohydrolase
MFLAMAKDIRVIVVKLADRLHNMRTLEHLPPLSNSALPARRWKFLPRLPIALGIGHIKWELEDLSFKYIDDGCL